ncbi:hypothetical protein DM01DRAFT_1409658 [Hesseltinella vesiculosa]|uniref:C2H2-type domain-containing protein n=1 Tax=Hesseltinella vesiculosa TaxID=101127 RepID=A0A1X2GAN7_9FUNG|nr:hypothetical protein DM01DRAFT_1409658 [Hesseltinella vesiculosa]
MDPFSVTDASGRQISLLNDRGAVEAPSSPDNATTWLPPVIHTNADQQQQIQQQPSPPSTSTKRKYHCTEPGCNKSFTTSGHLARHNRIHTGEKNFPCLYPGCQSRFSRQDNMMQHYRTHMSPKSRRTPNNKRPLEDSHPRPRLHAHHRIRSDPYQVEPPLTIDQHLSNYHRSLVVHPVSATPIDHPLRPSSMPPTLLAANATSPPSHTSTLTPLMAIASSPSSSVISSNKSPSLGSVASANFLPSARSTSPAVGNSSIHSPSPSVTPPPSLAPMPTFGNSQYPVSTSTPPPPPTIMQHRATEFPNDHFGPMPVPAAPAPPRPPVLTSGSPPAVHSSLKTNTLAMPSFYQHKPLAFPPSDAGHPSPFHCTLLHPPPALDSDTIASIPLPTQPARTVPPDSIKEQDSSDNTAGKQDDSLLQLAHIVSTFG